jgi:hypothetical protein
LNPVAAAFKALPRRVTCVHCSPTTTLDMYF